MLEEVLTLFMRRYGLTEPDNSAGCRAIQGAMEGSVSIAELRHVLTSQYELYPHYEGQVLAILDSLDEAEAVVPVTASAPLEEEPPDLTIPSDTDGVKVERRKNRRGRKTT